LTTFWFLQFYIAQVQSIALFQKKLYCIELSTENCASNIGVETMGTETVATRSNNPVSLSAQQAFIIDIMISLEQSKSSALGCNNNIIITVINLYWSGNVYKKEEVEVDVDTAKAAK
jgi:hypothetical protein